MKDTVYFFLVLFQATFIFCFLPLVCLSLHVFVLVSFHQKQEGFFLPKGLVCNKALDIAELQIHEIIGQQKVKINKIFSQNFIFWDKNWLPK